MRSMLQVRIGTSAANLYIRSPLPQRTDYVLSDSRICPRLQGGLFSGQPLDPLPD